jgi:hypothetical protein
MPADSKRIAARRALRVPTLLPRWDLVDAQHRDRVGLVRQHRHGVRGERRRDGAHDRRTTGPGLLGVPNGFWRLYCLRD